MLNQEIEEIYNLIVKINQDIKTSNDFAHKKKTCDDKYIEEKNGMQQFLSKSNN